MDTTKPIINPALIVTDLRAETSAQVIQTLGERLVQEGYTNADYIETVIEREKVYATGLPTNPPIAIPHADAGLSASPGVAVGLLNKPVSFGVMGTEDQFADVEFVFLLAVTDPQAQVIWLKGLIEFVQDTDNLTHLSELRSKSAEDAATFLRSALSLGN